MVSEDDSLLVNLADETAKAREVASDETRRAHLENALRQTLGNITHAAMLLGISKAHCMRLVKHFGLNDWACDLRVKSGVMPTGRPIGS